MPTEQNNNENTPETTVTEEQAIKSSAEQSSEAAKAEQEKKLKTARSITENCTVLTDRLLPTNKRQITTFLGMLLLGFIYYIGNWLEFDFSSFDIKEFIIAEAVAVMLFFFATDLIWDVCFSFIRVLKISKWLRNYDFGYGAQNTAYAYESMLALKQNDPLYYTEGQTKSRICIDSIMDSFVFLKHPKGRTLVFVQFFVGLALTLTAFFVSVAIGLEGFIFFTHVFEVGFKEYFAHFNYSEISTLTTLIAIDGVVGLGYKILRKITQNKRLQQETDLPEILKNDKTFS